MFFSVIGAFGTNAQPASGGCSTQRVWDYPNKHFATQKWRLYIYDSRRMEHASNERSRYHTAFSLDSEDYEGTNLISEKTPDDLMEELEDREHLLDCLAHLSENQRQRILMLAQGMSITEIARVQHADRTTVRESIQAARKKFKKYF